MQPPQHTTDLVDIEISDFPNPLVVVGASVRAAAESAKLAGFDVLGVDYFGDTDTHAACVGFGTWEQFDQLSPAELTKLIGPPRRPGGHGDTVSAGSSIPLMVVGGDQGVADTAAKLVANAASGGSSGFGGSDGGTGSGHSGQQTVFGRVLRRIDAATERVGGDERVVQELADPETLARIAIRSRTYFPPYRIGLDPTMPGYAAALRRDHLQRDLPGRWLTKRLASSGGLGIRWLADNRIDESDNASVDTAESTKVDASPDGDEFANPVPADCLRQLWQPGRSYGVSFLSDGGDAVMLGVCRSFFTRQNQKPFVYAGSYGPLRLPEAIQRQLQAIGQQAVDQTEIRGLFNVDVLIGADEKVCLLEINPRWSASMECVEQAMLAATAGDKKDVSLVSLAMSVHAGESIRWSQRRVNALLSDAPRFCKRIIYAQRSGQVSVKAIKQIARTRGHGFSLLSIHDQPADGTPIQTGDPVVSVMGRLDPRAKMDWRKTKRLYESLQKAVE